MGHVLNNTRGALIILGSYIEKGPCFLEMLLLKYLEFRCHNVCNLF